MDFNDLFIADDVAALKEAVEAGADLHQSDDPDLLPIHWATFWKAGQCLEFILAQGVDVNTPSKHHGDTPAHILAMEGEGFGIANILHRYSADFMAVNNQGKMPTDLATLELAHHMTRLWHTPMPATPDYRGHGNARGTIHPGGPLLVVPAAG